MNTFSLLPPDTLKKVDALARSLLQRQLRIATVESCTGGALAALFTELAGSSRWFERGFVTYSNAAKVEMVGVAPASLDEHGAVSEAIACEMAEGGLRFSAADCALSITGIAGPEGGSEHKPVGTVCFAWAGFSEVPRTVQRHFQGDRQAVRAQSLSYALSVALELLENK